MPLMTWISCFICSIQTYNPIPTNGEATITSIIDTNVIISLITFRGTKRDDLFYCRWSDLYSNLTSSMSSVTRAEPKSTKHDEPYDKTFIMFCIWNIALCFPTTLHVSVRLLYLTAKAICVHDRQDNAQNSSFEIILVTTFCYLGLFDTAAVFKGNIGKCLVNSAWLHLKNASWVSSVFCQVFDRYVFDSEISSISSC